MKKILLLTIFLYGISAASAQQIRTAYFMDKATARTALNPAFRPDRGYVGIPVLGSLSVAYGSNGVSLDHLLFQNNGRLVTFMDASVPDNFLNNLKKNNQLNTEFSTKILSGGWYAGRGFWTVGVGVNATVSANVPKTLFEFMKRGTGLEGATYNIKNLHAYADSYVDLSVGYSRPINDRLTVGGTYKFLMGAGNSDVYLDEMNAVMNGDMWKITSRGRMAASAKGLMIENATDNNDQPYIDNFDYDSPGIAGFGSAIDVGASYKILDNLTVSAAVLDFGFISWSKGSTLRGISDGEFYFDGFDLPIGDQKGSSIQEQLDDMTDNIKDLVHFTEDPKHRGRTTMLRSTINVGGEYSILDNRLSFGLLSSTRFYKPKAYTELTVSVNYRPVEWFATTVSYSLIHSAFKTFGLALNFSPSWINFFVGSDYMITKVTPQCVPIKAHASNLYFGLSVPLGKQKVEK